MELPGSKADLNLLACLDIKLTGLGLLNYLDIKSSLDSLTYLALMLTYHDLLAYQDLKLTCL